MSVEVEPRASSARGDGSLSDAERQRGGDERLAAIARATPIVLWEADPATFAFTFVSDQAEALLGFPPEEWVRERRFWRKRVHPDDQPETLRLCHAAIARREPHALEYRMLAADGREVWVENHVSCVVAGGVVTKLCGVLVDISSRKRGQEELRRSAERGSLQSAQALAAVGHLARALAHEFNDVLGTILGNVELAQEPTATPAEVGDCLGEIQRAAERATAMIQEVVAYSRPAPPSLVVVPLSDIVREATDVLRAMLPPSITISLDDQAAGALVAADPAELREVIVDVGVYAWRRAGDAPGNLRLALDAPDRWVRLLMVDDGPPLEEATRARLFEPSFIPQAARSHRGLATAHATIIRHGGTIAAESGPRGGLAVVVCLPATRRDLAAAGPSPTPTSTSRRVFVVDDEVEHARVMARALERDGHRVTAFGDPAAALSAIAGGDVDVLVTDFNMPALSGLELARRARELEPGLRVVLLSGRAAADLQARAQAAGIAQFLEKPVPLRELRSAVGALAAAGEPARRTLVAAARPSDSTSAATPVADDT